MSRTPETPRFCSSGGEGADESFGAERPVNESVGVDR